MDVSVRKVADLIPVEDKWTEISRCMYWSEGVADLIPLKISGRHYPIAHICTYPSEGVADWIPLEDKWKAISQWTYPSEGVADLISLADKWKVISL